MSITRAPLRAEQPYTVFANELLNDEALSAEALGILVYLVSKPPNWKVMPGKVGERFGCGRDKVYRILLELIEAGYASREATRDGIGKITGWNYLVSNEKEPLPENPEVVDKPLTENATSGKSAPQKKDSKTKERDYRPAKQQDAYSEEFEGLWKQAAELGAPRTRNTSKKKAWDHYRMLNEENEKRVRAAIPVFAAAMKAEGRPEDKIVHFEVFLSKRIWETVSASPSASKAVGGAEWHKTATRDQWARLLVIWRNDSNWRPAWGPAPGKPGCGVPDDLLTDDERGISKHAVDSRLRA